MSEKSVPLQAKLESIGSNASIEEEFNVLEWVKTGMGTLMKRLNEITQRGSLTGKVFTGGYVLIFGWVRV